MTYYNINVDCSVLFVDIREANVGIYRQMHNSNVPLW